ncbi:MAG: histidinol-phosphatase [Oscillospiraceae bacterium]
MKTNYHTHTFRCKHAMGSDDKYVRSAIMGGFQELGFSDHCPFPYDDGYVSDVRMDLPMLDGYVESVKLLKERYADKLSIKLGLECEYFPEFAGWIDELIAEKQLDFVIFGNHFYPDDRKCEFFGRSVVDRKSLDIYLESAIEGMELKCFSYMAHPDLFMRSYAHFDKHCEEASRVICEKAASLALPLEYNISGAWHRDSPGEGFPHPEFWRIAAQCGCSCVIGVDAHDNRNLSSAKGVELYDLAVAAVAKLGLNRLETIRFLR